MNDPSGPSGPSPVSRPALEVEALERSILHGVVDTALGSQRRPIDLAVLPWFHDDLPLRGVLAHLDWRLSGRLSRIIRDPFCQGVIGEAMLVPGRFNIPLSRMVLLGLGTCAGFDRERADAAARHITDVVAGLGATEVLVAMPADRGVVEDMFSALAGRLLGARLDARAMAPDDEPSHRLEAAPTEAAAPQPVVPAPQPGPGVRGASSQDGPSGTPDAPAEPPEPSAIGPTCAETPTSAPAVPVADPRTGAGPRTPGHTSWWIVADPRHVARLRRLLEGPLRPAGAPSAARP